MLRPLFFMILFKRSYGCKRLLSTLPRLEKYYDSAVQWQIWPRGVSRPSSLPGANWQSAHGRANRQTVGPTLRATGRPNQLNDNGQPPLTSQRRPDIWSQRWAIYGNKAGPTLRKNVVPTYIFKGWSTLARSIGPPSATEGRTAIENQWSAQAGKW